MTSQKNTLPSAKEIKCRGDSRSRHCDHFCQDGLIRVGGRLALSSIDYAEKHPVVLAIDSHLSLLLVRETHALVLHGGPQLTRSVLSRFYWIVQANRLIRSEIKQCVQCARAKGATAQQQMGHLPQVRVHAAKPF